MATLELTKKVKNPQTNRMIIIGGHKWKQLVKAGVLTSSAYDPVQTRKLNPQDKTEDKRTELVKQAGGGDTLDVGAGKSVVMKDYKRRLVRSKRNADLLKSTRNVSHVVSKNIDKIRDLSDVADVNELEDLIQAMIIDEMKDDKPTKKPVKHTRFAVRKTGVDFESDDSDCFDSDDNGDFEEANGSDWSDI